MGIEGVQTDNGQVHGPPEPRPMAEEEEDIREGDEHEEDGEQDRCAEGWHV